MVNFVQTNFDNVEYTRNVTWNSYSTYISPYSSHHYHTFLAHVKVKEIRQTKYLEVIYNPLSNSIETSHKWDAGKEIYWAKLEGLLIGNVTVLMIQVQNLIFLV